MSQMHPMNWVLSLILFIILLFLFMSGIYFIFIPLTMELEDSKEDLKYIDLNCANFVKNSMSFSSFK
uniref:ATP synthase F0 subunit 8 n=1 Tax=Falcolipeurus suturalis TaxID=2839002 RepID=A0A8F8YS82_9NEOP|nr:ATP synthase F0 subunit 8 [Falcolipeurus suturalis]